jgi:hypothetical protein
MGRCLAPCDGRVEPGDYRRMTDEMCRSIEAPGELLRLLEARMLGLAEQERFEQAALARDRLRSLTEALHRARIDRWLTAGRLVLADANGEHLRFDRGALTGASVGDGLGAGEPIGSPAPRDRADELSVVRAWLRRHPTRVLACDTAPAEPVDGGVEIARLLERIRKAEDPRTTRSRGRAHTPTSRLPAARR